MANEILRIIKGDKKKKKKKDDEHEMTTLNINIGMINV